MSQPKGAYRHLNETERMYIIRLRMQGYSIEEIAEKTGRSASTISRELRRNLHHNGDRAYYTHSKAHQKAIARRHRGPRNQRFSEEAWQLVIHYLKQAWSPEQISNTLRIKGLLRISTQTIYTYIYTDEKNGGKLADYLRHRRRKKRKRYRRIDRRGRITDKRPITQRPEAANQRLEFGHWEVDTVIGGNNKAHLLTLCERTTGFIKMTRIHDKSAMAVEDALISIIKSLDKPIKTITADNGTEFHNYKRIESKTGVTFYFATPYHSWERGSIENCNGLIRQFFPKGMPLNLIPIDTFAHVEALINDRPKKRLGFKTSGECYAAA